MREFAQVTGAIARRNLRHALKNPALLLPAIVFPLVFLLAFAGGLSAVGDVPGFDFGSGYTSFQFVFVFLQSAAFGGMFTGLAIATDFETGFFRRLMLAAPSRLGIITGVAIAALGRFAITATFVTSAGAVAGMQVDGTGGHFVALVLLGFVLNLAAALFGIGSFLLMRTTQAAPAIQTPVFLALFLAPVYVPLDLLDGWIRTVASVNPVTPLLEAGRGFISGAPDSSALAFLIAGALVLVMALYAVRALRRAETTP